MEQHRTSSVVWTERNREILTALTLKVRCFSLPQVARHWYSETPSGLRAARRAVAALSEAGFLERREVLALPELPLAQPVVVWRPGDPSPPLGAVSYQLQSRWKGTLRAVPVVTATKKAAVRFGGFARGVPLPDQANHDLHVAAIYLHYARTDPAAAAAWTSEETVKYWRRRGLGRPRHEERPRREKLPDAVLVDAEGNTQMVVEFGGAYDVPRVKKLHDYCEALSLPYELW